MGLFDEVRCEYPLPNAAHQGLLFQTKDLDNILAEYRITRRGRLVRTKGGWFAETRRRLSCPIHQDLRIYTSVEVGSEEHEWVEYVFRFTEGRVTRVRRSRDRHRFKVTTWEPGEGKATATETTLPTGEPEGRLRPGPAPRRPTVDEFHRHTPEKLELIDGHIPGEEDLLLLLLTSVGLRRAARLVGPKVWRSAAAPVRWAPPRRRGPGRPRR